MTALITILAIAGYLAGGAVTLRRTAWYAVRHDWSVKDCESPAGLDDSWILVVLYALLWPATVTVTLAVRLVLAAGLRRYVMSEPLPREERRYRKVTRRLEEIRENTRRAEAELDRVTSTLRRLQEPGPWGQ